MTKRGNYKIMKADEDFLREIKEIQLDRIKRGKDKRFTPTKRITLAIKRHNLFPVIKRDVINADLKDIRRVF